MKIKNKYSLPKEINDKFQNQISELIKSFEIEVVKIQLEARQEALEKMHNIVSSPDKIFWDRIKKSNCTDIMSIDKLKYYTNLALNKVEKLNKVVYTLSNCYQYHYPKFQHLQILLLYFSFLKNYLVCFEY